MPTHDNPHDWNAFKAGQHDFLHGQPKEPRQWGITDAFRMVRYSEGYEAEQADLELVTSI